MDKFYHMILSWFKTTDKQFWSLESKHLLLILALALLLRTVLLWSILNHNNYNTEQSIISIDDYYEMGENIISGRGFSSDTQPPYSPSSIRVPIYPYFVATILWIFESRLAIAIIQSLISLLIPVFSYLIVRKIFAQPAIALVTGLFLALEPFTALLSLTLLTETIFTVFWLLFVYFFYDFLKDKTYKKILISGLFFGLACLTRPNIFLLSIFTVGFMGWRFRKEWSKHFFYKIALWGVVVLAIISPWIYRNYRIFNTITFSAHVSDNLYLYLIPSVFSVEKNISFEQAKKIFYAQENITDISEILKPVNSKKYTARALTVLSEYPSGLIKTLGKTMVSFFIHDGYIEISDRFNHKPQMPTSLSNLSSLAKIAVSFKNLNIGGAIILAGRLLWIMITISSLVGVILTLIKHPKNYAAWWAISTIAFFAGTTLIIGFGVNARFRFAVNPFIIMFAIYAWYSLFTRNSKLT